MKRNEKYMAVYCVCFAWHCSKDCMEQAERSVKRMKEYIVQARAQETIDSFDAHNAPELIRCKDCKKRKSWECWQYFLGRIKIPDDWFCADGERREKNER